MLKQAYLSLTCDKTWRSNLLSHSTQILFTTSRNVTKDMKSIFQYLFHVPSFCFNPTSKTVMHSMKATSGYVNHAMTIFFFIKSQKLSVKIQIKIRPIHRHLIDLIWWKVISYTFWNVLATPYMFRVEGKWNCNIEFLLYFQRGPKNPHATPFLLLT